MPTLNNVNSENLVTVVSLYFDLVERVTFNNEKMYQKLLLLGVVIGFQNTKVFGSQEAAHLYNELFGDGDFNSESALKTVKHLSR